MRRKSDSPGFVPANQPAKTVIPIEHTQVLHRLVTDFKYFAAACLKIQTKDGQLIPFKLNKVQNEILKKINACQQQKKPVRLIIVKARQLGVSTLMAGYIFWQAVTKSNRRAMIVAHRAEDASGLLQKSHLFYQKMPEMIRPDKKSLSKTDMSFLGLNSSLDVGTAGTGSLGRSRTLQLLHLSECAFYNEKGHEAMLGVLQTVSKSPETVVTMESTANGMDNWFYDEVIRAERTDSDYQILFFPWFDDPGYTRDDPNEEFKLQDDEIELKEKFNLTYGQLKWRRYAIVDNCQGSIEKFKQEYPSTLDEAFVYTGHPVFDQTILKQMRAQSPIPELIGEVDYMSENIIEKSEGPLQIFEYPQLQCVYTLGVDTAHGIENAALDRDYSVVQVFDAVSCKQVAIYRGRPPIEIFPFIVKRLGEMYNNGYIIPESNDAGRHVIIKLRELGYYNIYRDHRDGYVNTDRTDRVGFNTNRKSKIMIISNLAELIRTNQLTIYDKNTIDEMAKFTQDPRGRLQASTGHDDTVMAMAMAVWGFRYAPVMAEASVAHSNKLIYRPPTFDEFAAPNYGEEEQWITDNIGDIPWQ